MMINVTLTIQDQPPTLNCKTLKLKTIDEIKAYELGCRDGVIATMEQPAILQIVSSTTTLWTDEYK